MARASSRSRLRTVVPLSKVEAPTPLSPPVSTGPNHALHNVHTIFTDYMMPVFGAGIFFTALPYMILQIILCTLWEGADRRSLDLVGCMRRIARLKVFESFTQHTGDGFIVAALMWLGVVMPALCIHEALYAREHGIVWWRVIAYNVIRIGPMYKNFAHVYTLAHKEYHTFGGVFIKPLNTVGFRYAFNWIVGPFFGVLPGTFTHSHQLNHHKYNNGRNDIYSTGGYARDSFWNFMRYVLVWFGYASNITTVIQFVREGRGRLAAETILATFYYFAIVAGFAFISPEWACLSLVWAFVEGNILLAMVNWVWHAFIDGENPNNDFTTSTTIVNGEEFIFSEEYHVV